MSKKIKVDGIDEWTIKFMKSDKIEFFETIEEAEKAYWDTVDGETTQTLEEFLQDCFIVENGE